MNILITGGTGFIGKALIPKLINKNHNLLIFTSKLSEANKRFNKFNNVTILHSGENHQNIINKVKNFQANIVIHLAALISSSDEYNMVQDVITVNVSHLVKLLDAVKYYPPDLFINTGTYAEYYNNDTELDPAYFYAATKTASRYILKYYSKSYKFKYINVIPYSIYGPNDSQKKLIDYLIESSRKKIDFTPGEQILDFIHVDDVANAFLLLSENHEKLISEEDYHLGTGNGISIIRLSKILEKVLNRKLFINWGAKKYRKRDIMKAVAPLHKNNMNIPWEPSIDLETGIKMLCKNIR